LLKLLNEYTLHSDEQLLLLLQDNNESAFEELYNRYWEKLIFVAANRLGSIGMAEEVVQEIFLNLWKRRLTVKINFRFSTYMAAALKYKIIDTRIKRRKNQYRLDNFGSTQSEVDNSTQQKLEFEELLDRLARLVDALPEKCQIIYKLNKENGKSAKEIASQLHMPEKTVESHLYRAIRLLKTGLQHFLFLLF
jgi:RNA polymerase sigma-70 factor (family 1)